MKLISSDVLNSTLLNKATNAAKKTENNGQKAVQSLRYRNLLNNKLLELNNKQYSGLQLSTNNVGLTTSKLSLFKNARFQAAYNANTGKWLVECTLPNTSKKQSFAKYAGKTMANALATAGWSVLSALSLPLAISSTAAAALGSLKEKISFEKPALNVTMLKPTAKNKREIKKIIETWKQVANAKAALTQTEAQLFNDSTWIGTLIGNKLASTSADESRKNNMRIVVCHDSQHRLPQAIAIIENQTDDANVRYKYVDFLMTNPINIRSSVNNDELHRVAGAATAVLTKVGQLCLKEKIETIKLWGINSAIPFYHKVGFVPYIPGDINSLVLTKDKFPKPHTTKKG